MINEIHELWCHCDHCSQSAFEEAWYKGAQGGLNEFKSEVRELGWRFRRIDGELKSFCPSCLRDAE